MRFRAIVVLLAVALLTPFASAGGTNVSSSNDGDGAIVWGPEGWEWYSATNELWMDEILRAWPAHVLSDFTVDGDPIVQFWKDVENGTGFDWTDYHITIIRRQAPNFSILSAIAPVGWDPPVITQPILMGSYIVDGLDVGPAYVGAVDYFMGSGSPILIGASGLFNAKVSFLGNANFILEQIPTPEPGGLILLGLAGVAMLRRRCA